MRLPTTNSPQAKLESAAGGRIALSVVIVAFLVVIVVGNLPGQSYLSQKATKATRPVSNVLGIDQNWGVFAPDPRRQAIDLEAQIEYRDGVSTTWHLPLAGSLVGGYHDYRWRKYLENVIQDSNEFLWEPTAMWIARHRSRRDVPVDHVTLVRRWYDLSPPGKGSTRAKPYNHYAFYTLPGNLVNR